MNCTVFVNMASITQIDHFNYCILHRLITVFRFIKLSGNKMLFVKHRESMRLVAKITAS